MNSIYYLIILSINIKYYECMPISTTPKYNLSYNFLTAFNLTDYNITTHLQLELTKKICNNRSFCNSNDGIKICAVRIINETYEFKDFENECFLFLTNMCEYPGTEYMIAVTSNCNADIKRRHYIPSGVDKELDGIFLGTTAQANGTSRAALRVVGDHTCPDRHKCPVSCLTVSDPVCMDIGKKTVNYKSYVFINHCTMDMFFCENYDKFPTKNNRPDVRVSPLYKTFCAADRYIEYLFTSKTASTMGHHGWLDGDEPFSKILEPWQRKPGYG